MPNGTTAPGKTLPPFLVPMSGSTYGVGSRTGSGAAAAAGAAVAGMVPTAVRTTAISTDDGRKRMTRPLLLRTGRAPQVAQAAGTVTCATGTTEDRVRPERRTRGSPTGSSGTATPQDQRCARLGTNGTLFKTGAAAPLGASPACLRGQLT